MSLPVEEVTIVPVTGTAPYDVVIGHGLDGRVPAMLDGASTVVVVSDGAVAERTEAVATALTAQGITVERVILSEGEQSKGLATVAELWDVLGRLRVSRSDAVVAIGGGATTDVAGFAAATWLRGIRVVHVPTTLLAMVDAAVGGKTGINTAAGKNLVGSFHPPAGVVVDLDVLESLPDEQWRNGMAEVVKAGFIADPAILDLAGDGSRPSPDVARELVERSVRVKAEVVGADLREAGPRESLNYGHTLGHAIERVEDYRMPHGHAVSIGLVYAAALGRLAGRLDGPTADRHRQVLTRLGLPTSYPAAAWPQLREAMRSDKKSRGAVLRFVVLDGIGRPGILADPHEQLLEAAYSEVAA